ncbi:hypothetical protein PLANPX_0439 [Lacipirellula parvula]|uniref:DUF1549 domain-containing protein n=2 Tax=Lacipirellula parvula TaxID=2650471 RepID=A0A5K7X4W9_9BACT|nr:hypothetical protein PLANPX_0439 [Lacipirellula parvula]
MTVARFVHSLAWRRWLCGGGVAGMLFLLSALVLPTHAAEKLNVGEAAEAADASAKPASGDGKSEGEKFLAAPETDVVVARIDALLRAGWQAHNLRPSRAASDGEWCRRVYLDLLGRTPTVAELDAYLARRSKTKRAELVNRLLGPDYADDFARNWTTVWTNVLIGRTGGTDRQSITSRSGMKAYLSECFAENRPYNQMVRELITASGDARPEMPEFNGAVNFLVEKLDEGGVQAAAKSAQIFLGMSVQCTQCHNHPFNEHRQNQFWELNAFFRQARVEVERPDDDDPRRLATLSDADIAGEGKMLARDNRREIFLEMKDGKLVDRDQAELYSAPLFYELRNGQLQVAYPAFVDGRSLAEMFAEQGPEFGNSGRLAQVNRRAELAKLMLAAPELERAAVNRLWAHFMGYGFTKPIDDMGSHNPPSHPELLEELANDFRAAGFDMKQLMRWIALSEAYGLSSEIGAGNKEDDPEQGRPPQFSRFYVRQMGPEQLYESLLTATHADAGLKKGERERLKEQWLEQFNTASGNDEGTETTSFNGSIPQALTMMNGELVRRACSADSGGFLDKVANNAELSDREKISYLYRAALGRLPGKDETKVCNELLAARYGNVVETLQDVWWAVLNSNEFILNH